MLRFLFGLFEPFECKVVRKELEGLCHRFFGLSAGILSEACDLFVTKNPKEIKLTVRAEHIPASHCAAFVLQNLTTEFLISGRFHTYRGVLSDVGKDMLTSYLKLMEYMLAEKILDREDFRENLEFVKKEIQEVG